MSIADKIASAKKTNWLTENISETEVKTIVELAKISASIERRRIEMGMTQTEFAEFMGISQGMVSKWESREYNFTINTLNEICQKLDLSFSVSIDRMCANSDYRIIKWDSECQKEAGKKNSWVESFKNKEAIA